MKYNLYYKILAVGIICLFIGVGIHPAFAVDTRQSMVNTASEDDCGCNEVDDRQLVVLEEQLNRLEVYSKLLFVLSKQYPELREDIEGLSNKISTVKGLLEDLTDEPPFPFICVILWSIFLSLSVVYEFFAGIFGNLPEDSILRILVVPWLIIFETVTMPIYILLEMFDCVDYYYPPL